MGSQKPVFDPNQAYTSEKPSGTKPAFNPNQTFTSENGEWDPDAERPFIDTSLATSTAHTLLKPFDYASGVARTAIADNPLTNAIQSYREKPKLATPKDWEETWKGNAPALDEYAARAGIPEGPRLSDALPMGYSDTGEEWNKLKRGGALDPSVRGAASMGVTMVTDPLMYIAPGARLAKSVGGAMWKKALQPLDRAAEAAGKGAGAVSGLAMREGIATGPTMRANMEQLAEHAGKLYDQQRAILRSASLEGATVNAKEVSAPLHEMAAKYEKLGLATRDPEALALAQAIREKALGLEEGLAPRPATQVTREVESPLLSAQGQPLKSTLTETIPAQPGVSPEALSDLKTFWGQAIPQGKWATYAETPLGLKAKIKQYQGAKTATENAVESVLPSSGNKLKSINEDLGTLLSTRKKQLGEVGKEEAKKHITAVDGMIGGLAAGERAVGEMGSSNSHGIMALIKKAIDLKNAAGPASYIGSRMYKLGQTLTPAEEEAARQILINAARPEPWGRIYEQKTKEGSQ